MCINDTFWNDLARLYSMKMLSICTIFHWFVRCALYYCCCCSYFIFFSFFLLVSILFSLVFGLIWLKNINIISKHKSRSIQPFTYSPLYIIFVFLHFCYFFLFGVYTLCIINLSTCIFLRIYFIHKAHITSYLAPMIHNPSFKRIFR